MAKPKNAISTGLEYALAQALLNVLRVSPRNFALTIASAFTRGLALALPRLRRVALKNLSFAFPDSKPIERQRIVDGVFESLARLLVAFAKFPALNSSNIHAWIRYEGLENYQRAKDKGRGVLIATAHLGNWELSAFAHALMTEPMFVMVRALDNPLVDTLVEDRRQLSGNQLLLKKDVALSVVRALRANAAVGILIDQNTAADEGVFIDFFGKKACAGVAFAKLAARTGAAVVPGFAFWEHSENKYVLRFYPELEMSGDAGRDTQKIHTEIERHIREYPEQWMWIHRRWRTRPPGEESIY
ncbi:MAG: lysophospholipid acyltransferase family protein [Bryobacteraceae bacterium]